MNKRACRQVIPCNDVNAGHAEYPVRLAGGTECFLVDEVAPSAYSLSDEESQGSQVSHRPEIHLAHPARDESAEESADDAAVDRKSAVPDRRKSRHEVVVDSAVRIKGLEYAVVYSRPEESAYQRHEHDVEHSLPANAEALSPAAGIEVRQDNADGDQHAVPVDFDTEKLEPLEVAYRKAAEQVRERQLHFLEGGSSRNKCIYHVQSSEGVMTERQQLPSSKFSIRWSIPS